jgi:hypothetical protein
MLCVFMLSTILLSVIIRNVISQMSWRQKGSNVLATKTHQGAGKHSAGNLKAIKAHFSTLS